jgi:hypothetical protein
MARIIRFEGRSIQVPDDATDDEVASILDSVSPVKPAPEPKAEGPGFFDRLGSGMNSVRDFMTSLSADKPESVLQGKKLPEPEFNAAEAERLSNRAYAEQQDRDLKNIGKPRLSATKGTPIAVRNDGVISRAADLVGAQVDAYSGGLGMKIGDLASAVGADGFADTMRGKANALIERSDAAQKSVSANADGSFEKYAPQILSVFPTMAVAAVSGGLPVMFGIAEVQAYGEGRKAGLDPNQALLRAVGSGAAEVIGEKLGGTGKLIDALENAAVKGFTAESLKNLSGKFLASGMREVPSEEVTYAMQFGIDKMPGIGLKQDATLGDFIEGAKDTAIVAAGAGGMMTGAGATMSALTPASPEIPSATDIARDKGFLVPETKATQAPKVEDMPTTPKAPDPQTTLGGILKREGLINGTADGVPSVPAASVPAGGTDTTAGVGDGGSAAAGSGTDTGTSQTVADSQPSQPAAGDVAGPVTPAAVDTESLISQPAQPGGTPSEGAGVSQPTQVANPVPETIMPTQQVEQRTDVVPQTTSTLSPQAQSLQTRMRAGQNANNGTNTGTASTGLDSTAGAGRAVGQGLPGDSVGTQATANTQSGPYSGGQTATAASIGSAPTTLKLAPRGSLKTFTAVRGALSTQKPGLRIALSQAPLTEDQKVASGFIQALGGTFNLVEEDSSTGGMPNGFVDGYNGRNYYFDAKSSTHAPLVVAVHEGVHGLPERIRKPLIDALNAMTPAKAKSEFITRYGYSKLAASDKAEEVGAYLAQLQSERPDFWQELRQKMGNKDFSALATHILSKLKEMLGRLRDADDSTFLTRHFNEGEIAKMRGLVTEAYSQAMKEQGLTPDENVTGGVVLATKPEVETAEQRQYKLDVERDDRTVGAKASVSTAEIEAITTDGLKLGLNKAQIDNLIASARDTRKRFPPKAGWAPIEATGVEAKKDDDGNVKVDKKGNPQVKVTWKPIAYAFNVPPGSTRAPAKMDTALVGKVADQFTKLVNGIYTRAEAGDKNAQVIIGHQTWYRNVAAILRQEFGAQGDLFADLLGATSPNTPVDTNWRFAVEVLTRFSKGEFDAEMKAFTEFVDAGGQPSKFPGAKIRQASGKLYGMNSKNSMLALADLWRAVEAGTAPKARNFALNLIGQSNMATIDVWAARMLRRAAGMVRGSDLPRIPTVAEQGVTGVWNADTSAVTGEFGFGAAVLDRVSADLAKKGIDLSPPDLQALAWFAEKELWTEKNWTSAQGEGGSFEERIEDTPTSRYLMGFSVQQGNVQPEESVVTSSQARLLAQLRGDDSVISARVLPTYGLFMGKPEEALDLEWTVKKGQHNTAMVMAEAAAIAKDRTQQAIFISRVLSPAEESPNARPGAEVYFKKNIDMARVKAAMQTFTQKGLDGFTLAVDPRAKASSRPGGEFIGLRIQYVPEFDESATPENVEQLLVERQMELIQAVDELSDNGDVAFAAVYKYDTEVVSGENYDEYIDRGIASDDRSAGGQKPERSVRQRLERAAARIQSDAGPNSAGSVSDAVGTIAFANKPSDGLGGVYAERGQGAREHAVRIDGTHFSRDTRSSLDGRFFGRGLKGAEQSRLAEATDPRIKERVYFYVNEGKGVTPEAGVGGVAHAATVGNLYNVKGDPLKLFKSGDLNGSETRVLDAGFDGYYFPNYVNSQGIAIVLGKASRGIAVTPTEYTKGSAPAEAPQPYKRALTSKELNAIDLGAVQAVAPSAKLRMGNLTVDAGEVDAARTELAKQGIDLPATGPVFSNKAQNLNQDIVLDIPVEGGKTAKLTVNAQRYIDQLNAREDALRMVKECMA